MIIRGTACSLIIIMMLYQLQPGIGWSLDKGECMRDYPFIWTEKINVFLRSHLPLRNAWMIYAGFLMDFIQLSGVYYLHHYYGTYRVIFSFGIFYGMRAYLQNNFILGRPVGFLWFDPGFPALTIPYHDMNDFYYSGHVGSSFMYLWEFYQNGFTRMGHIGLFINLNMWVLLIAVRTHYWIDLVSGLMIAHFAIIMGERASYLMDVKVCGYEGKIRTQHAHTPCKSCGWSNNNYFLNMHK